MHVAKIHVRICEDGQLVGRIRKLSEQGRVDVE